MNLESGEEETQVYVGNWGGYETRVQGNGIGLILRVLRMLLGSGAV